MSHITVAVVVVLSLLLSWLAASGPLIEILDLVALLSQRQRELWEEREGMCLEGACLGLDNRCIINGITVPCERSLSP